MTDFLTEQEVAQALLVPHFKNSREASERLDLLYLSYAVGFVDLLGEYHFDTTPKVIADIGTGYGWLAAALARRTTAHIIAVEPDPARMVAAQRLASIFGVEHRIEWRGGGIPGLPLDDWEADVTFCIEVIEHVGTGRPVVEELGRVTRDMLVVTTPNRLFPWLQHDTFLPFCHWLPLPARNAYAALFGRRHLQDNNLFWSPGMLLRALPEFERVSRVLQFRNAEHFRRTEKIFEEASGDSYASLGRMARGRLFSALSRLDRFSLYVLPNLASTFRRRPVPHQSIR